jgi:sugar O-acyltransferase (sialic acid O-acetyltransferase NeuD family)
MYLYGASGHAKVIIDILKSNGISITGIFDDNLDIRQLMDYKVIGRYDPQIIMGEKLIVSIGNNEIRARIAQEILTDFGIAIHNSVSISPYSSIDIGTVVMHNAVIQSHAKIGKHTIINSGAIIEHDCIIEDFVHISPNATICGNVKIGKGTHIGAGSTVIPGISVGKWSIIGAGSVIIRDIPDHVVVIGNPGKIIKTNRS